MLGNKTNNLNESERMKTKPAPSFLVPDYPYQAGEEDFYGLQYSGRRSALRNQVPPL